jgi:hypothetical protein
VECLAEAVDDAIIESFAVRPSMEQEDRRTSGIAGDVRGKLDGAEGNSLVAHGH